MRPDTPERTAPLAQRLSRRLAWLFGVLYLPFLYQVGLQAASIVHPDFPTFYYGAQLAFVEGVSPYQWANLQAIWDQIGTKVLPLLYPPPALLAFYPFVHTDYATAKIGMLVLNHLCFLAIGYMLLWKLFPLAQQPWRARWMPLVVVVYFFCFMPLIKSIEWGQVNLWALLLLCLAWYGIKRGYHPWLIALPLVGAILLKVYLVLLVLVFVVKRRFRHLVAVLAVGAMVSAVSALLLPGAVWHDWLFTMVPSGSYTNFPEGLFSPVVPRNQSLHGFIDRLFLSGPFHPPLIGEHRQLAIVASYMTTGSLLISAALLLARRASLPMAQTVDHDFSLLLLTMFLVAPFSWEVHMVLFLPALVLMATQVWTTATSRWQQGIVLGAAVVCAFWVHNYEPWTHTPWLVLALSAKLYAVCALWLVFASHALRAPPPVATPPAHVQYPLPDTNA